MVKGPLSVVEAGADGVRVVVDSSGGKAMVDTEPPE